MSKRGEFLALGDPSPSVAKWLLASPGTAAMGSWDALLCSGPEREWRDTARAPGEPPKVTGGAWRVEFAGSSRDS